MPVSGRCGSMMATRSRRMTPRACSTFERRLAAIWMSRKLQAEVRPPRPRNRARSGRGPWPSARNTRAPCCSAPARSSGRCRAARRGFLRRRSVPSQSPRRRSSNSIQWETGVCVPACRWAMQPMLALAMAAGAPACRQASLFVAQLQRECPAAARSTCRPSRSTGAHRRPGPARNRPPAGAPPPRRAPSGRAAGCRASGRRALAVLAERGLG
jgi:hypothetical protein